MPLLKTTKTLSCSFSSKNTFLTQICLVNLYIVYTSDDNVYVPVFVFKDKYYTKLTLIFQPIELFLSSYLIFNFSYSSCSYYLYLLYIVFASVYMYPRRLHKFTTCVLSIYFVLYDNKICLMYLNIKSL